ncbi:MAG: transketolase [Trueperaceae bacterium]
MSTDVTTPTITTRSINAIRALAIDAIQKAGSGHPGLPLGAAPMGYTLFARAMRHNPKNPLWFNRDRYVQSAGHGSMLQYALLHLSGYPLTINDIKQHRQLHSKTPGHPEVHHTEGVETTTGPLGQGLATAVGMAIAEAHLAARFNQPDFAIVDHYTYVIASDGDLMEGITAEASSLAGHLKLGKLIVFYDDNSISLDGPTHMSFSEDVLKRYEAYGWHTQRVENDESNNIDALEAALNAAKQDSRPSLISVRSTIGYGAPKAGTQKVHGSALGAEDAAKTKVALGIDWPEFTVPKDVTAHYANIAKAGAKAEAEWKQLLKEYTKTHKDLGKEFSRLLTGELPADYAKDVPGFKVGEKVATRKASQIVLNALAKKVPELMGGSADLAESTYTDLEGDKAIQAGDYGGRIVRFGVREHAMAAAANGMSLHGGLRPFVATFLIFSDYLRPALRLGALMEQPVIYPFTHDSVALGGDGPTHQPISQLTSLRLIPNVTVIRPADANETAQAWVFALEHTNGPIAMALSRQNLPNLAIPKGAVEKGGYILADSKGKPDVIVIATGSEVSASLEAKVTLDKAGIKTRVVSMPSTQLFDKQSPKYKESVLPSAIRRRVAVEAGATMGWYKYVGLDGVVIGLDRFGASGEGDELLKEFGFTAANIVKVVKGLKKKKK